MTTQDKPTPDDVEAFLAKMDPGLDFIPPRFDRVRRALLPLAQDSRAASVPLSRADSRVVERAIEICENVPRLIAIVREQAARIATVESERDELDRKLGIRTEQYDGIGDACKEFAAERDALRDRLAKLESALSAKELKAHLVSKGMPIALAAKAARIIVEFIKGRDAS